MTISEQNKQKAEKVLEVYKWTSTEDGITAPISDKYATIYAIQDRQSVLEAIKNIINDNGINEIDLTDEITNLTEQN